jgi:ribonuclease HI
MLGGAMKCVTIHSDGACLGNPGPGGWAAVLTCGAHRREIQGGEPATTNNRMELQAAIEALSVLKRACEVDFYTDSQYLRKGVMQWMERWKRGGWQTLKKEPVKNADLWRLLDHAVTPHTIRWHWLKGHAGHLENERCDVLAKGEISQIQKRLGDAELRRLLAEFKVRQSPPEQNLGLFVGQTLGDPEPPTSDLHVH